ncbi:hypothetical protein Cri9333_2067 [Crinalium epipsammum PCC 9333]|uniref:DUF6671 domain-containing protein n=1 Tax=Crinalium epipsammum PCC 9333 TaxID=1173022 RepID=K9W0K7_9CYAN|nr:DUF6671 family protein [Crinalium epipsammum]AFZ12945.1 hypothetical protein Cri9333_2067 [Crinalium epipsammum PCC 9333]
MNHFFKNRNAVIATQHHKEKVIAPMLEKELGIKATVPPDFDTDIFGTFTRDIERMGNQLEAARFKALKALEITGETIVVATEGSFSPHPEIPFIPCHKEIVIFIDIENNLEIIGQIFSTETNYAHKIVKSVDEAWQFAHQVGFPEHGLIVMTPESDRESKHIFKGITSESELQSALTYIIERSPTHTAHIETDMRAMYNPTRMKNIEKATHDLINNIQHICPSCSTPGFQLSEHKKGLLCANCYLPTSAIKSLIYKCRKCGFTEEKLFPDNLQYADPAQCLYCNP